MMQLELLGTPFAKEFFSSVNELLGTPFAEEKRQHMHPKGRTLAWTSISAQSLSLARLSSGSESALNLKLKACWKPQKRLGR